MRKRHYQFGKPRPPNWAFFLLNILLLTQKKACSRSLNHINFFFNGGIITASQQATFYGGSAPHIGQNVPKWGFKLGLEPFFFAAWRGPARERMVRSTPPPRSGAEGKKFTPKAYLHTSFCVQKMGDPVLSFRLHQVLFCVEHKSTLPSACLTNPPPATNVRRKRTAAAPSCIPPPDPPSPSRVFLLTGCPPLGGGVKL